MNDITNFILQIVAVGGGSAVLAYIIFTWLGKTWLENKFTERLEEYKRKQNQELEHYRYQINALFNRITKIHEKEFEVLPETWKILQDALGLVSALTAIYQTYPDLRSMNTNELEEFILKSEFSETQKNKLREATDKNEMFVQLIFWKRAEKAMQAVNDFHNYLIYNKIFLTKDLFDRFSKADNILRDIVIKWQYRKQSERDLPFEETHKVLTNEIAKIVEEIEKQVQERLHYLEA